MNDYNKVILNREVEFEVLVCLEVIPTFDHEMALWLNLTLTYTTLT